MGFSDADQVPELYERYAHAWDRERGADLLMERAWMDRFTRLLARDATILDLGCGSGQPIAKHLIEHGFSMVGVDSAPTLISLCRDRFPAQEWVIGDMRTLTLGRRFHGILAWDSFFHLTPDAQRRMFSMFEAHAAPGAALMFTSGPEHGEVLGSYRGEPLYHASLSPSEYRELLVAHGFALIAHQAEDAACGGHTIWLAQALTS